MKSNHPLAQFSQGSRVQLERLIGLHPLANQLPLAKQKRVFSAQSGTYTSRMRGRGIDFSEVRGYQQGDDIRHMDWRVTARSGTAHVKVFTEERDRPIWVVCDLSAAMHFGTQRAFKSVVAADICALIGWASLARGDKLGALIYNDHIERDLRPKARKHQVLQICQELAKTASKEDATDRDTTTGAQRFTDICAHLKRVVRPGSQVYIVSDWRGFNDTAYKYLHDLSRHNDVIGIHIYDGLEKDLPPAGRYPISDGQHTRHIHSFSKRQCQEHARQFSNYVENTAQCLQHLNAPFISIATDQDPLLALQMGLGIRPEAARSS